jgi:hypothetical protein
MPDDVTVPVYPEMLIDLEAPVQLLSGIEIRSLFVNDLIVSAITSYVPDAVAVYDGPVWPGIAVPEFRH